MARRAFLLLAASGVLWSCGGHPRPRAVICAPGARALLASRLGVPPSNVSQAVSTGNNEMPQCVLSARGPALRPVRVTVNLDNGPQPYFRLERTAVEASQQFGTERLYAAPQQIPGLGLDADWFPDSDYLETTDGARLITVTIGWPASSQARRRALAVAMARPFLGRLRHNPAAGY